MVYFDSETNKIGTLELANLSHEVHNVNQRAENSYRSGEIFIVERFWMIPLKLTIMNLLVRYELKRPSSTFFYLKTIIIKLSVYSTRVYHV